MYSHPVSSSDPIKTYLAIKRIQVLRSLERLQFSGQLLWSDQSHQQWTLYFQEGQIIYATGGSHPIRRWRRQVQQWCPHLAAGPWSARADSPSQAWDWLQAQEYHTIRACLAERILDATQATRLVRGVVGEVLLDILRDPIISHDLRRYPPLTREVLPVRLNTNELCEEVQQQWQIWSQSGLLAIAPNQAVAMRCPQELKAATTDETFQMLHQVLDGRHTIRDIALTMQCDVIQVMGAIQPYLQLGWLDLVSVQDLSPSPSGHSPSGRSTAPAGNVPLIACVDDSLTICQSMEKVVRAAGYHFVGVLEAPRAIATLLRRKPDLIFLDLIMPETNGYEICSQLRKVSLFKTTPIIILTGNDGVVDQVRARLLGASDFLSKPMEPAVILSAIHKHLSQSTRP